MTDCLVLTFVLLSVAAAAPAADVFDPPYTTGRTTTDNPLQQRLITDCLVKPGQGVVNVALNGTDAFNINVTALNSTQRANLPVVECPVGTYGPGNSTSAKCVPCPAGSSTTEPGSTSAAACSGECPVVLTTTSSHEICCVTDGQKWGPETQQ
jgi:hypothetical protein